MELAFIISAIRRYFWVVILLGIVGAAPGILSGQGATRFESRGVLQIVPPVDVASSYSGDPDRYVVGQLSVLRSTSLAQAVADLVGDIDATVVSSLVSFSHEPKTDIVGVVVSSNDAAFSQRIVDAYLSAYVGLVGAQIAEAREPVEAQIDDIRRQLEDVNNQISAAMVPYLTATPAVEGEAYPPIPGIDQVVPSLASSQSLLVDTLVDLQQERARVQSNRKLAGIIVQEATLPTSPNANPRALVIALGGVAGGFFGVLAAVVIARLSPRVLDHIQAEEILGTPIAGFFPRVHTLVADRRLALEDPPTGIIPFVDWLCVRAEASSSGPEALTIVVVGTQRSAGVTTLASAVASQFAANGAAVLLVDGDLRHPELTSMFGHPDPDSADRWPRCSTTGQFLAAPKRLHHLNTTIVPNLYVASFSGQPSEATMRRKHIDEAVAEAKTRADVVVFDGGPLMAASSTVQLSRVCDVVIVAMPGHQNVRPLGAIAATLRSRSFLPVATPAGRSSVRQRVAAMLRRIGRRSPDRAVIDVDIDDDVEPIAADRAERPSPAPRSPYDAADNAAESATREQLPLGDDFAFDRDVESQTPATSTNWALESASSRDDRPT